MKNWVALVLLLAGMPIAGWCGQDPLKLGQVTIDELKMKVYEKDSTAAAWCSMITVSLHLNSPKVLRWSLSALPASRY
ncbi:hypothetical protein [Rufibacter roseus]|uniref:hypothetical protein n=1 Tax=Rufibacter roseus TaxID=1567108 RepID=UPI0013724E5B|nr:hypothetical protein [Rufibacter roseus]